MAAGYHYIPIFPFLAASVRPLLGHVPPTASLDNPTLCVDRPWTHSQSYRKCRKCVSPHFVWRVLTNGGPLANKSTIRPLKPVYSSHQEHGQDPDTTLVDSTFIPSPLTVSKRCPRELRQVCSSVDDFWRRIEQEQDDTPLDIRHLVLDLQDNGVRLFVSRPRSSRPSTRLVVLLHLASRPWF